MNDYAEVAALVILLCMGLFCGKPPPSPRPAYLSISASRLVSSGGVL
jgi:hypothetical protein